MPTWKRPKGLERALVAEEVASILRHDLRNKHAAIRQAAIYLQRRVEKSDVWTSEPRIPRFFALIDAELTAADAVIADKTALPQLERARERTDVALWLGAALDAADTPATIHFVRDLQGPAPVDVDVRDLWLAVECVLENSVEALPAGGRIAVATRATTDRVMVRIHDDGPGMPELQPAPFQTRKPGHAGVGLRLARRAAARCGGTLSIASSAQGTQVEITLPLAVSDA